MGGATLKMAFNVELWSWLKGLHSADSKAFGRFKQQQYRLLGVVVGLIQAFVLVPISLAPVGMGLTLVVMVGAITAPLLCYGRVARPWLAACLLIALLVESLALLLGLGSPAVPALMLLTGATAMAGLAMPAHYSGLALLLWGGLMALAGGSMGIDTRPLVLICGVLLVAMVAIDRVLHHSWVTQRKAAELAALDSLTGIFNRRLFTDLGTRAFTAANRYKRVISVLTLDIDRFKTVNDTYGHGVGDDVIRMVAGIFSTSLRETDIYGRIGGEEFAAILPETPAERALEIAERIREAVEHGRVMQDGGRALKVTISIGVTTTVDDNNGLIDTLAQADRALYAAKEGGRNRVEVAH